MAAHRRWLADEGFDVRTFSFDTVGAGLDVAASALAAYARTCDAPVVHFVGHSLGGLVILRSLLLDPDPRPGRAVLWGSPVQGSSAARSLMRWSWGRRAVGRPLADWFEALPRHARWPRDVGMIAGDAGTGFGRLVANVPVPNDGTVSVRETRLPTFADHVVLPVSHSGMLLSRQVSRQTARFLRTGRFRHGGGRRA